LNKAAFRKGENQRLSNNIRFVVEVSLFLALKFFYQLKSPQTLYFQKFNEVESNFMGYSYFQAMMKRKKSERNFARERESILLR